MSGNIQPGVSESRVPCRRTLPLSGRAAPSCRPPRTILRADESDTATNLPVIAVVPRLKDGTTAIAQVLREPLSPYAESLRRLSISLLHSVDWPESSRIVAVGSAIPEEGRSTLAASLGRLLAGEGRRVLLIDCDWIHPEVHRLFHVPNETGLTSLLGDRRTMLDDAIRTDALSGLDIVTAGRVRGPMIRGLASARMRSLLATVAKSYELVLLDMPPVLMAHEVLLLSRMVDRIMFAVRWRYTRRKMVQDAIERILSAEGDMAGVVLTCVNAERYRKS
ncbi:MAG: CpsD/CapB family tyrosine-protein kinase [Methanobacterium sp.]|nr:CpsD/CapB family tyrosine-protein kinase [Methanobacterium sp.]